MQEAIKYTLKNGLRVVICPMPKATQVSMVVTVRVGSEDETEANNGYAHFSEHMRFQGTKNRRTPYLVSLGFDKIGAEPFAFTEEDHTGYHATVDTKDFPVMCKLLGDIFCNSIFPEEQIPKEKRVVLEEIKQYEDDPQTRINDLFYMHLYRGYSAGFDILGSARNVENITRKDLLAYKEKYYVPGNTVVSVAGGIRVNEALSLVKKYFGSMPSRPRPAEQKFFERQQRYPSVWRKYKNLEQAHVVLGFRAFPLGHKYERTLDLISAILFTGAGTQRMYQQLREDKDRGLYFVSGSHATHRNRGYLYTQFSVSPSRAHMMINAALEEFKKLKHELVGPAELAKAKKVLAVEDMQGWGLPYIRAHHYGVEELFRNTLLNPRDVITEYNKITAEQIRFVARKTFVDERLNLVAVGRLKAKKIREELHV